MNLKIKGKIFKQLPIRILKGAGLDRILIKLEFVYIYVYI